MKTVLAAALLAVSAAAIAQAPQGRSSMQRVPGVSEQGTAILNEARNSPNPQLQDVLRRQESVRDQLSAAATAQTIDVDRVAALIKQREDLQSQARQLLDARLVNALRQLPVADRGPFLRALAAPPPGARQ